MRALCATQFRFHNLLLGCVFLIGVSGIRDENKRLVDQTNVEVKADGPETMNEMDLFNIHDLLLVGYWAPLTKGPHVRKRATSPPFDTLLFANGIPGWPAENVADPENAAYKEAYAGLSEARKGAVTLANIISVLHPVQKCREQFQKNMANAKSDEELVEKQAATAWDCVGVSEENVRLCGFSGKECHMAEEEIVLTHENGTLLPAEEINRYRNQKALTKLRHEDGTLLTWEEVERYRNFELTNGDQLGACYQPLGTGGPVHEEGGWENFKGRTGGRKTAWLRACSYWSAFHALALRADALQNEHNDMPNLLFGSIVRIIAGGALFCGG